jgi:hypothetical protein
MKICKKTCIAANVAHAQPPWSPRIQAEVQGVLSSQRGKGAHLVRIITLGLGQSSGKLVRIHYEGLLENVFLKVNRRYFLGVDATWIKEFPGATS